MNDKLILDIVQECISKSVSTENIAELFTFILNKMHNVLNYDYAFIAEVRDNEENGENRVNDKFYRYHAFYGFDKLDNSSPIKKYYLSMIGKGGYFDFTNMNSLHGKLLKDDVNVVNVRNVIKKRDKPFPKGHPPISSFKSYKLEHNNHMLGIIGCGKTGGSKFDDDFGAVMKRFVPILASIFVNIKQKLSINKHKDAFLANMSHEIRTPLHGIVSLTKLLVGTELNKDQKEFIDIISQCSVQLLDIVNDILDYSKINTGKMKFINEPVELKQCIENARDLVLIKQNEKNLPIIINIDENIPKTVVLDKTRICQVLVNILGNAYKFTSEGRIELNAHLMETDVKFNNCEIYFTISDTGIGIPKSNLETVFDSFHQLSNNIFVNNVGVGLGLPISKYIVDKMNGKIWIDSTVGKGSVVHFTVKCGLYHNTFNLKKLGEFYSGKNFIIIDHDNSDKTIIFNTLLKLNAKPILCLNIKDAIMYINSGVYVVEYIIVNIDNVSDEEIQEINGIKNSITKIVAVSNAGKEKLEVVKHHYDVIKPVTMEKILTICNTISKIERKSSSELRKLGGISEVSSDMSATDNKFYKAFQKSANIGSNRSEIVGLGLSDKQSKIKILVAEDNENNKIVITKLLQSLGYYNIHYAANGIEMVQGVSENIYDIVFVDLKMPIMDGITATKNVFKTVEEGKVPMMVALTASVSEDTRKECFDVGMKGFLTKPVEIEDLDTVMTIACKRKFSSIY